MQFVVEDSTNANERAILVEGWNLQDPPAPIDISAVTLLVSINGDTTPDNADGTLTRLGTTHLHRFVFNNSTQFQAFAAGDVGALIVPHSTTGDGRMGTSYPFYVAAGNPGSAALTAAAVVSEIDAAVPNVNVVQVDGATSPATVIATAAAAANRDDFIDMLQDGVTIPATSGTMVVKNSAGVDQNITVTTSSSAQGITATT